jgi:hypothetical protein
MPNTEYVQLHDSKMVPKKLAGSMMCITLSGSRRVMVGKSEDENVLAIRLESPEPDSDRMTFLNFGLSVDAAQALYTLLKNEL